MKLLPLVVVTLVVGTALVALAPTAEAVKTYCTWRDTTCYGIVCVVPDGQGDWVWCYYGPGPYPGW